MTTSKLNRETGNVSDYLKIFCVLYDFAFCVIEEYYAHKR